MGRYVLKMVDSGEITKQNQIMEHIRATLGEGKHFALVETYGCQQNVNDSQRIMGMLEKKIGRAHV